MREPVVNVGVAAFQGDGGVVGSAEFPVDGVVDPRPRTQRDADAVRAHAAARRTINAAARHIIHGHNVAVAAAGEVARGGAGVVAGDEDARLALDRRPGIRLKARAEAVAAAGEMDIHAEVVAVVGVDALARPLVAAAQTHILIHKILRRRLQQTLRTRGRIGGGRFPDAAGRGEDETLAVALFKGEVVAAQGALAEAAETLLRLAQRQIVVGGEARLVDLVVQAEAETLVRVSAAVVEDGAAEVSAARSRNAVDKAEREVGARVAAAGDVLAVPDDDARLQESDAALALAQGRNDIDRAAYLIFLRPDERREDLKAFAEEFLSGGLEVVGSEIKRVAADARLGFRDLRVGVVAHIVLRLVGFAGRGRLGAADAVLRGDLFRDIKAERIA